MLKRTKTLNSDLIFVPSAFLNSEMAAFSDVCNGKQMNTDLFLHDETIFKAY